MTMTTHSSTVTPANAGTSIPPLQTVDPEPVYTSSRGSAASTCLAVNQVPNPKEYHTQTGLVHGVVHRVVDSGLLHNHSTQLLFSLQTNESKNETVILTAHKEGSGVYGIFNVPGDTQIATLKRFQTNSGMMSPSIWYSLETNDAEDNCSSIAIATILYDVPSLWKSLMEAPPRRAHMALVCPSSESTTPSQPSTTVNNDPNIVHDPLWFGTACQESIRRHGTLEDVTASLSLSPHPVVVLENVVPYDKPGGRVGLNMHGRGRHPSNKNMQLAIVKSTYPNKTPSLARKDGVACQFAKWDANVYHLDYAAPLTSLTAFGFAIAQMDL